ncbi:hypothetical protein J1G42_02555 [Cellulomonas sp. zg-ZUI222]|uniref:hypothetical protein n=1 Tax=Cellulomonas wangleii TaxID=2816956 RepID=UPI001A9409C7|nr:hypothetical protein [Cellulomonas wangleii]MBO0919705.1 hypothetical protein [Cellulomonas wangleii]
MGRVTTVTVVVGMLALAGCTSQAVEPPGLTASPTPQASAEATPEPTPESSTQDMSDPELGIIFDDVPTLTGDEADVWNTVATYQVEYWRTMTTNTVSPAFAVIASADVQAVMERIATNNTADAVDIGGTFRTRVSDVTVTGDTATAAVCDDYRDATFADADGPDTPETAGFGYPRRETVQLQRLGDRWVIGTTAGEGSC